jgi:hypothetical protein
MPAICSALAPALTDLGPERQAELRGHEGLGGDGRDHNRNRQADQADAETDGQLVQADADPERDQGQAVTGGQAAGPVLLFLAARQHTTRLPSSG